jgi:hypothetical protein
VADIAHHNVAPHQFGIAFERIAITATAGELPGHDVVFLQAEARDLGRERSLPIGPRIEHGL